MKKYLLLACALFLISFAKAYSNFIVDTNSAYVGLQPVFMFENDDYLNIFCLGRDANYNDLLDSGDEKSSWWRCKTTDIFRYNYYEKAIKSEKIIDLDFGTFPFRPVISNAGIIYMPLVTGIKAYDNKTGVEVPGNYPKVKASALSLSGDSLFISFRHLAPGAYTPDTNFVYIYDLKSGKITDTIPAKPAVQMTSVINTELGRLLVVLNEDFGTKDGYLTFYDLGKPGFPIVKSLAVGLSPNHFDINSGMKLIAVASNMSHKIYFINLKDLTLEYEAKLETTGYNGPREVRWNKWSNLNITTYYGKVFEFTYSNKSFDSINTYQAQGKAEGLFFSRLSHMNFLRFAYTNINQLKNYDPSNVVSFIFDRLDHVQEDNDNSLISTYPNPCSDIINIKTDLNIESVHLYNGIGEEFYSSTGSDNKINIKELGLLSGTYKLIVKTDKGDILKNIAIIK